MPTLSKKTSECYRYIVRFGPDGIGSVEVWARSLLEAGAEFVRLFPGEAMTMVKKK